jgi:hypothetical protein
MVSKAEIIDEIVHAKEAGGQTPAIQPSEPL